MKHITLFTLAAIMIATAAQADDPQLRNRIDVQRSMQSSSDATVAVYVNHRGIAPVNAGDNWTESRFEIRTNARGQNFGIYAPSR